MAIFKKEEKKDKFILMSNNAKIWIPGSKSQTIRALLIASFAKGKSIIRNPLISSDTLSTLNALSALGAVITYDEKDNVFRVDSENLGSGFEKTELDLGNSGTGAYLLLGLAASLGKEITIKGDESLSGRPIGPLSDAYRSLGADIRTKGGALPITIKGPLKGGKAVIECRTSQYLSSLLLAACLSEGDTEIECPLLYEKPYVTMTLSWLDKLNIDYRISPDYLYSTVKGRQAFKSGDFLVSGDYSSASFFFALAALKKKSITVLGLDKRDPQGDKRVLEILSEMGCTVTWLDNGVTVTGPEVLKGGTFDLNDIPDALPILSALATAASSDVKLTNVPQARIKETDRISAMHSELKKLGADVIEEEDGLIIKAGSFLHGADIKGYKDHRIIMAFSILGEAVDGINIDDKSHISVTFPTFYSLLDEVRREWS